MPRRGAALWPDPGRQALACDGALGCTSKPKAPPRLLMPPRLMARAALCHLHPLPPARPHRGGHKQGAITQGPRAPGHDLRPLCQRAAPAFDKTPIALRCRPRGSLDWKSGQRLS